MKTVVHCGLLAVGIAIASYATPGREGGPGSGQAAVKDLPARVAGFAPAGWRLEDKVLEFTPENLYEQIDGRAEFFLAYDVVSLTFADFENVTDTRRPIELSIYDMGTVTNAFGVYSAERSGGETTVSIGRAAYRSGSSVYAWRGQYYLQVIALSPTEDLQQPALELARKAAAALPDSGESVWGLTALPEKDRVPDSVKYFQVDALGLDFMRNTYTAQYRTGGALTDVFLSRQDSAESTQAIVTKYAEYAGKYGKGVENLDGKGGKYLVCNMGNAFDVVFQTGRLVAGVTAAKDRTHALDAAAEFRRQLRAEPQSASIPVPSKEQDPVFSQIQDDPGLPRVLLIGDSISMGYTLPVRELLKGKANVHRIPENGGPTTRGLEQLKDWLGAGRWDVIHFNWGLHDLKYMDDGKRQTPIREYKSNLKRLVKELRETGAKLIWASTTPVPEGKVNPPRRNVDVIEYNKAAKRIMEANGVMIDDLYALALPKLAQIQHPANVHFTDDGSKVLAGQVAQSILKALGQQ